jgi:hypothetical protein
MTLIVVRAMRIRPAALQLVENKLDPKQIGQIVVPSNEYGRM